MGGAVSVIPNELDQGTVQSIMGKNYEQEFFDKLQRNGTISKQVFAERMKIRTDAFLTHDWGVTGDNHRNVAKINASLQELGVTTWFDEEQLQGNIKKQMVQGIDNANCVVVFITRRYVEKVSGENASDNCQLEFNYAGLQKTGTNMIAVVMEPDMRNTKMWGECGMVLGNNLYIDMSGDLNDADYRRAKCEELKQMMISKNGKLVAEFNREMGHLFNPADMPTSSSPSPAPPPAAAVAKVATSSPSPATNHNHKTPTAVEGPTKPLDDLTVDDVGSLLEALNLTQYKSAVVENHIDGPCLSAAESADELKEMGISMTAKAKMLFNRIVDFKVTGVPEEFTFSGREAKRQQEAAAAAAAAAQEAEELRQKQAAAAAEAAATAVPATVTVSCHRHQIVSTDSSSSGWACNGKDFPGGCKSGCTGFKQLTGKPRWRCAVCDFDLCEGCTREHRVLNELPATIFTALHAHTLVKSGRCVGGWGCDGRSAAGAWGCRSGTTGFSQLSGWNRYSCQTGCDFDLCEKCLRAHLAPVPPTIAPAVMPPRCPKGHTMFRNPTSTRWKCDLCSVFSTERWKCDKCNSHVCEACLNACDAGHPPTCKKGGHVMQFSMHKLGAMKGPYEQHRWKCGDCGTVPEKNKTSARFFCPCDEEDLCGECGPKHKH